MAEHDRRTPEYEACVAYYRDTLPCAQRARVRAYLEMHAHVAQRARLDAAHESAVARHWDAVLDEPLPPRLQVSTTPAIRVWPRRLAMAATIVLSAAGGWWLGDRAMPRDPAGVFATRVAAAAQQPAAGSVAIAGHDLSAVPAPDLSARGYQLVQQQRVDVNGHALVEFVYRNRSGQRVRIYAETGGARGMAPTMTSQDGMSLALWRDNGTHYALVGDVPALSLRTLAQAARTPAGQRETQLVGAGQWPTQRHADAELGVYRRPAVKDGMSPAMTQATVSTPSGRM